ncbi:MAG: DUF2085 domain-containing protein [Thermoplasmatales archaeon]|nr:MAG: DUF2085 domain-containing protein [Thermoplasmatales archaeon]
MQKREKSSRLILLFFIPFLIWILLQFIAPFAIPANSIDNLSGIVGIADNEHLVNKIPGPWDAIYSSGDRLCHQQASRSFFINGNQMPFCSRCTAIWLGFAIGLGFMVFFKIELNEKFLILLIIGIVPIAIDGIGQLFGFWESTNIIRLITGLLAGIVCGIAISLIIDEIINLLKEKKINLLKALFRHN